jgi:hypothetical protein
MWESSEINRKNISKVTDVKTGLQRRAFKLGCRRGRGQEGGGEKKTVTNERVVPSTKFKEPKAI